MSTPVVTEAHHKAAVMFCPYDYSLNTRRPAGECGWCQDIAHALAAAEARGWDRALKAAIFCASEQLRALTLTSPEAPRD